ncbi:MAG: sigma-54 dependent transcriptional regulator [Myxococcota bacterium]|jgi:two-component system response regulator PilR (NtrC family)|nr:sigma-54 dependent transcriptional regulator [Myxococcota bacterium]HBU49266.1 Fis family transcriptional regulator [Myxococcales bacterium]
MTRILIVDDEPNSCSVLGIRFKRKGFEVETLTDWKAAILRIDKGPSPDIVLTDLKLETGDEGLKVLSAAKQADPETQVIVMTAFASTETAVTAMRTGAYHYLTKPLNLDEVEVVVDRALERRSLAQDNVSLRKQLSATRHPDILGKSLAVQRVLELVQKVAAHQPRSVLITGQSGTGKELVARAVHNAGTRAKKPFVPINCGAIPENLVESELFGAVRGAYTGATTDRIGLCEEADGGTLFLDEIGELPLQAQVKFLRLLQERRIRRVGDRKDREIDVRIIAATNRNLKEQVREGHFRDDLFFRLNVVEINVPPLSARREDIPMLVDHFVDRFNTESGRSVRGLTQSALHLLNTHPFEGNVRELENIIERGVTLCDGDWIDVADLPPDLGKADGFITGAPTALVGEDGIDLEAVLETYERQLMSSAMDQVDQVKTKAADLLGLSFRSFRYRYKKLFEDSTEP